jgi:hypothetical protein
MQEAIRHIYDEDGSTNLVNGYVKSGLASGLCYLMGTSASDRAAYLKLQSDEGLDFSHWDKAKEFWSLVAKKSAKVEPTLELLLNIPEDAMGGFITDFRCGVVAKSWDLFLSGKEIKKVLLKLKTHTNDMGRPEIIEHPLFGGIDIREIDATEEDNDNDEE